MYVCMCGMYVFMLCYVMLCYVMLCYVMLCYVMLCFVMLYMFTLNYAGLDTNSPLVSQQVQSKPPGSKAWQKARFRLPTATYELMCVIAMSWDI